MKQKSYRKKSAHNPITPESIIYNPDKRDNKFFNPKSSLVEIFYLGREILDYDKLTALHLDWFNIMLKAKKLVFLAPRSHFKTTCFSIVYPIYRMMKNHNIRILLVNEILDNAKSFLREIKAHLQENEKFQSCFGRLDKLADRWNEEQITIPRERKAKEPTIAVAGVEKSIVSQHADLILVDDPISDKNCQTAGQREKVKRWLQKTVLPILEPDGQIGVIGTRWHNADLYSDILEDRDFKDWQKMVLAAEKEGKILFPERYTKEILLDLKDNMGTANYNCQYLNDPSASVGLIFKHEWLKYFYKAPDDVNKYQGIDLAISKKEQGHFFSIVTIALDLEGNIWIVDMFKKKIDFPTQIKTVKREAKFHNPTIMIMEANAYQEALPQILKSDPEAKRLPIKTITSQGDKVRRITSLSPLFENGTIRLVKDEWNYEFEKEYLQFPKGSSDDSLDALHLAVSGARSLYRRPAISIAGA